MPRQYSTAESQVRLSPTQRLGLPPLGGPADWAVSGAHLTPEGPRAGIGEGRSWPHSAYHPSDATALPSSHASFTATAQNHPLAIHTETPVESCVLRASYNGHYLSFPS